MVVDFEIDGGAGMETGAHLKRKSRDLRRGFERSRGVKPFHIV
ncbi:MAG: hypothetical protein WDM96_12855 [Lacunisphaera sp.]